MVFTSLNLFSITSRTDRSIQTAKKLFLKQAAAYFDDLNVAEAFCVKQGRKLIRISLEELMQDRINTLEKKWISTLFEMQNEKKASRILAPRF